MDTNQLKALFIEEATEIIEKLDIDIIHFEENPGNSELLDELYRGVHTLKGSANAFEFSRLGDFVHHFEDALTFYRNIYKNTEKIITSAEIDTFLEAVDLIKAVMEIEIEGKDSLPQNYASCLEHIKTIVESNSENKSITTECKSNNKIEFDLGNEFDLNDKETIVETDSDTVDIQKLNSQLQDSESLFCIKLILTDDIFIRGFDHLLFYKLLASEGRIIESYWDMTTIPFLEELEDHKSYIGQITIHYATKLSISEINEFFEYLENDEYETTLLDSKQDLTHATENQPIQQNKETQSSQNANLQDTQIIETQIKEVHKQKLAKHSFIKVDTLKLDELFDSIAELVIAQNFITEADDIKNIKNESVEHSLTVLSKITRRIQNGVMSLRMVPIHDTFEKMKRVARDASKKVSKDIKLIIEGAETEIDKTMIDALSDPLIHIIRNAIDHGIENDLEERLKAEKTTQGKITLKAYHQAGNVAIEIRDDGRGINKEKVLNKAIEKGLIDDDSELSDNKIYALIMQAGFSTADQISDISGRGVGLDVVRNAIEKLKGKVEINSQLGMGTRFTIFLPLTLAIIDGMTIKSEQELFIIPTLSIIESFIPVKQIVHTFKKEGEFVDLRGEMLPVVRLNSILDIAETTPKIWESTLICIENEKGKFALLVDDIIGTQQVVIKSLDPVLAKVKELAGSAIMGNGEVALILNTEALFLPNELV